MAPFRWWQKALRDVLAEEPSLWAAAPNRGEQQWNCYWGMGQLGNARECLTCAVTQVISTISSNPQGYHFSCPFLLDCFCHHKSRCSGFGREEAITLKGCSALQNNIQFGCDPEELQHFRDSLAFNVQKKKWYTITSAGLCFSGHLTCLISCKLLQVSKASF